MKKAELRATQDKLLELTTEHQAVLQELNFLRTASNIQNVADFEAEVKRRVDVSTNVCSTV